MDLQTISSLMKVVIQKHQIVVTEMRKDPQNPVLQKRLHDLQLEIHTLNERQKQVVEDLRKNFGKKNTNSAFHASTTNSPQPSDLKSECTNHKVQTTTKPVENCLTIVPPQQPPTATFALRGPLLLPPATTTLLPSENVHPVLVVPSPSNHSSDTGVLMNLVPPIRVPQYNPPHITKHDASSHRSQEVTTSATIRSLGKVSSPTNKTDQKKKEFVSALGLVSKDSLTDVKSRKRRSTANPHFSNAALEEKWKNAAALAANRKPRGRPPRLDSRFCSPEPNTDAVSVSVTNGIHSEDTKNVDEACTGTKSESCCCQKHKSSNNSTLKAAKDDQKQVLLKKSLELRLKRSQLESRLLQLKELSGKQKNRQSLLQSSVQSVEMRMDCIHNVIKMCS